MMHRQRLNPVRQQQQQQQPQQQQQQQHHHMGRGHEVTLSPRTPQSPQTVRRKMPSVRPEQMTTTGPVPAPAPAPAVPATRCLSRARGKGAANQAGDWGARMAKPNVGRRGGVSNQPMQAEQSQQQQQRNHQHLLPRVARLGNNNHTNISNNKEVAGAKNVTVPPIACPPLNLGTREGLPPKSPYLPSGSEIQMSSMPDQTTSSTSSSSAGRHRHRIKLANAIRLPDQQNKSFVYLCKPVKKVKELLTARQLRQSNEHLDDAFEAAFEVDGDMIDDPIDPIDIDNVIKNSSDLSSTTSSPYNSLEILQKRQLEVEEHFSSLPGKSYQQMLQTQLRQVRQQETQLQRLANCSNNQQDDSKDNNNEDENENVRHRKNEKLEKLVCQNIPTLQNEIKVLQQLGEKLVATLRVSTVCPAEDNRNMEQPKQLSSLSDDNNNSYDIDLDNHHSLASQSSSIYYTPRAVLPGELVIRKICCLRVERVPTICETASVMAAFHHVGVVKEFRIEKKTLNEIKTGDDTQCFYMPSHTTISPEGGLGAVGLNRSYIERKTETAETAATIILAKANELRCTSFRKLRENPNVLIQQLRPKSTMRPFNLLEQDTILFINSLAHGDPYKVSSSTSIPSEHREAGGTAAFDPTTRFHSAHDRLSVSSQTFGSSQLQTVTTQTDKLKPKLKSSSSSLSIGHRSRRLLKRKSKSHLSDEQARILKNILTTTPTPTPTSISAVDSGVLQRPPINRRRRPRQVAPCGRRDLEPKVHLHLLKTVAVGIVQIAVFLVLIMAFTYPDIRC